MVCGAGSKCVAFTSRVTTPVYTHFVALSPLNPELDVHVWSLKMSGMVFDFGYDAIAIMIMHPDRPMDCTACAKTKRVCVYLFHDRFLYTF